MVGSVIAVTISLLQPIDDLPPKLLCLAITTDHSRTGGEMLAFVPVTDALYNLIININYHAFLVKHEGVTRLGRSKCFEKAANVPLESLKAA